MTVHLHHLEGCAPTPLAHYLKALGILRVVAQQKDPDVRGFWRDQHFCLVTTLDSAALEAFFLEEYAPTAFVSPWNRGSGFYAAHDKGIAPVEASTAPRFQAFRTGIAEARLQLGGITSADAEVRRLKDQTKAKKGAKPTRSKEDPEFKKELAAAEREFKRQKANLYAPFATTWRGSHRDWMDAAMVLATDDKPAWPALLGTGGADGRLDFTNTCMQRLGDIFQLDTVTGEASGKSLALLRVSLFETPSPTLLEAAVGQFLPGSAGGANGTTGPDADSQVNPWDFVLMLEGTTAFRGQATRRLGCRGDVRAAIPFAVTSQGVGHATVGRENATRGEQWMPLWGRPSSWNEVRSLLGEGRAQLGRTSARRPLDFARAIARLGVARGLTAFMRYGYLERNGQSNLAVPLGRIGVAAHPLARLTDEIGGWVDRLVREAEEAPARLATAVAILSGAMFDVLTREAEPSRWQSLLIALAEVEGVQASGTAFKLGPCPTLSPGWLAAADDDSPEWRLAVALGSSAAEYKPGVRAVDPIRAHALPLDPKKPWSYAVGADKRLVHDPRVVMKGRDPWSDLVALVDRRLVEASRTAHRSLPLVSAPGAGARLDDLARLISGELDVERIVLLGRALMAVDWRRVRLPRTSVGARGRRPDEAWEAVRLCTLAFPVRERAIVAEPAMVRRLAAGDASAAVAIALRRLRASGLRPAVYAGVADAATSRRWAAALAFPIEPAVAEAMAARFANPTVTENS